MLGDDVIAIGDEQGDVAGDLVMVVRDEHDVPLESLEDSAFVPARSVSKDRLREPEESPVRLRSVSIIVVPRYEVLQSGRAPRQIDR